MCNMWDIECQMCFALISIKHFSFLYIAKLSKCLQILERRNYKRGFFVPLLRLIGDLLLAE